MKIRDVRVLQGPNVWAACPVLEIVLDLEDLGSDREVHARLDRFSKDLLGSEPARDELMLMVAHTLAAATCKLQEIAGTRVAFAAARKAFRPGLVLAAAEFAVPEIARAAFDIAWRLLTSDPNVPTKTSPEDVQRLRDLGDREFLSPTVATTFHGAKKRGLPVTKLSPEYGGYLFLGQGSKQRRVRWSEPDAVSGVARLASTDKYLTNQLLRSIGVPVPKGRLVETVEEAWSAALEVGLPVAVKPYNCDCQTGVSLDLRTQERVEAAFQAAIEFSSWALVEHFAPGMEHRVLVVGERVVAVTKIEPPQVVGDGVSTVAQLVEKVNQDPRRSGDDRSEAPLSKLKLDEVAESVLASQGYTVASVPAKGTRVLVRRDPPYFKNGGTLADLTDQIHPITVGHVIAAAHMMQIPVAGLDVVAVDISKPLEEQAGVIIEINANPGLWLHLGPWADSPRPVGEEIAAWLFQPGNDGRIPVIAMVGDADKSVQRHLTALLTKGGYRVSSAGPKEMSANGRRWPTPAGTPQERAHVLFRNPVADIALFETDGEELLGHGFATDRCDAAVILSPVPTTKSEERDPAEFVQALTNALSPTGVFVVTSAWSANQLGVPASRVILVAGPEDAAAQKAHLDAGGLAAFVRGLEVVLSEGAKPATVLGPLPAKLQSAEVQNVLAAIAAGWVLGQEAEKIGSYLHSLS